MATAMRPLLAIMPPFDTRFDGRVYHPLSMTVGKKLIAAVDDGSGWLANWGELTIVDPSSTGKGCHAIASFVRFDLEPFERIRLVIKQQAGINPGTIPLGTKNRQSQSLEAFGPGGRVFFVAPYVWSTLQKRE